MQQTRQLLSCDTQTSWAQVGYRENSTYHPQCIPHISTFCVVSQACMLGDVILCGLWTNLFVQSHNGQKACDKRLARSISYIHHTSEYQQCCYVGNTADLDYFLTLILHEISKSQKINIRRSPVHFRERHDCANKLDVQEADFSFTHLYGSGDNFSWCRLTHGRYSRAYTLGCGDWHISFRTEQDLTPQRRAPGRPVAGYQVKHAQSHPNQAHQRYFNWQSIQHNSGASAMLYVFEDNEAVIKIFSKVEVRQWDMFHGPTEFLCMGCLTGSIWTPKSNQVHRRQKPTCRHSNQRKFHTWRM